MPVLVLDIDGTIANNDHRAHYVDRKEGDNTPKDWEGFLQPHLVGKDVLVEGAKAAIEHFLRLDYSVVFVTGRREALRDTTMRWIKEQLDIDATDTTLLMRPSGNMLKATEVKREAILALRDTYRNQPMIFVDDDKYMWPVYAEFGLVLRAPQCWESMFPHNAEVEPVDIWRK